MELDEVKAVAAELSEKADYIIEKLDEAEKSIEELENRDCDSFDECAIKDDYPDIESQADQEKFDLLIKHFNSIERSDIDALLLKKGIK